MTDKIIIAGGTGFIGRYLQQRYQDMGYEVILISRSRGDIQWGNTKAIVDALEGAGLVINLAGKSVDCRYNEKNKKEIFRSRTETTREIGEAISQCLTPPRLWINSGTATIYRHAEDRPMTESHGDIGSGFSVDVAKAWENAFFERDLPATRRVVLRISIVLGKNGGAMQPLLNLVRFGLGGKQGNGKQMFSWIHLEDLYRIIRFLETHHDMQGVYNCAAPAPVTNQEMMATIRRAKGIGFGLPSPEWLLKVGAVIIKTETELVLKSRWVLPERLQEAGFEFKYPDLRSAINEIVLS